MSHDLFFKTIGVSASLSTLLAVPSSLAIPTQAGYNVGGIPITLTQDHHARRAFWDAATSSEAVRLDAETHTLAVRFARFDTEEANDDYSLLVVQPENLEHFTPEYGTPINVRIVGFEEGKWQPLNVDEIDLEIFDV